MRVLILAALLASPVAGVAQNAAEQGRPPERIRSILLKPGEKCPPSTDTEVVVCASIEQPYRIPREFRDRPVTAANNSWVNRAATLDEVGREAGGLPNTCSPVGFGGQGGCLTQMLDRWRAERRAAARAQESVP